MNRRRSRKKVILSPEMATLQYDLQHPNLEHSSINEAKRIAAKNVARQEEAEAQAKKNKKKEAEANKKAFEDAIHSEIEQSENRPVEDKSVENKQAEDKDTKKEIKTAESEVAPDTANTPSASVQSSVNSKTLYDYLEEDHNKINNQFFKPVKVDQNGDFDYVVDISGQAYNANQKRTVQAAADREIQQQYGTEINEYNYRLQRAKQYDTITNQAIDQRNQERMARGEQDITKYEEHVDTAGKVKEQWENSETYQKIQQTKNIILQKYTPNEALANKVQEYGTSQYNPTYLKASTYEAELNNYKAIKKQYDNAVKKLNELKAKHRGGFLSYGTEATDEEYGKIKSTISEISARLVKAERALSSSFESKDKYERNLESLSNQIRTKGLPRNAKYLDQYSKYVINQLGLSNVLYNKDGSLNEEFVGVGYASDEDINNAAKQVTDYFSSTKFKSGLDVSDDYLKQISDEINTKKEMYEHLAWNDVEAGGKKRLEYQDEYIGLERAQKALEKAKRHKELNNIVKAADGFWTKQTAKNIGYGVYEKLKDPGLWTFGLSDWDEMSSQLKLSEKIKSGQTLTAAEKSYASALAIESVMHQNYGEYEKTMGYTAGQVATESMKLMAQMAMGSGLSNIMQVPGKAAMKTAASKYVKKFGADGFKNILGRNLVKVPGLAKVIGADALYSIALANTLQLPSTLAEVDRLETGQIVPGVEDGQLTITDYEGTMTPLEAWYTAEARGFTENMSEMIGEYGILQALAYPFKYFGKQAIKNSDVLMGAFIKGSSVVDGAQQMINRMLPTKAISSFIKPVGSFIKAGHYSGIVGETAEEYYGNAMQHLLGVSEGTKEVKDADGNIKTVKTSFWEEINPTTELGKQTFLDIVGGIALSTGFLGGGSMLNYARIAHNYDRSKQRLIDCVGKDMVEKIENSLSQAHSANVAATANTIIKGISDAKDREAFIDFYESMMKFHGASQADQKVRESVDFNAYERAKRDAEANGYSIQYNQQRADLQRGVDVLREYAEQHLDLDSGVLDDILDNEGGAAEYIQYLKDQGEDTAASIVMAYNNAKTQYEASMRRLMDDIDEDLANNERWVNRLSNSEGKIVVGTTKEGNQKIFVKSGTKVVDGKIKVDGKQITTVKEDGSVSIVDADKLNDSFEEVDANEIKHNLDVETYRHASNGFDLSGTAQKIGHSFQMSQGRIGTIISRTPDNRIMYSINDPSTNTEVIRIADAGVTEEQLTKEWTNAQVEEFKNNEIKKAQQQLEYKADRSAQVVATNELREYIKSVKEKERKDLENKHGKAIQYSQGVLTVNTVDDVLDTLKQFRKLPIEDIHANIFARAGVAVDPSNWKRLERLIMAYNNGQLTRKQLKEILCDGSTNMSKGAKEDLQNISVDQYGNVTWWKDPEDVNAYVHLDTSEYDLSEETLADAENIITESIHEESKKLNTRNERKKRGEAGREVAKQKRAEKKKLRKQKEAEKKQQNTPKVPTKVDQQISKQTEPIPTPAPADITAAVVKSQQMSDQKTALDKLNKQVDWTKANVLKDQTTGHNYFILVNGKRVMFTRVHGILDDQYENLAYDTQIAVNIEALTKAYNEGGIDALVSAIENVFDSSDAKQFKDTYISYLKDNPSEYAEVIEGVVYVTTKRNTNISVTYGNYLDELLRKFFRGEQIDPDYVFEDKTKIQDIMFAYSKNPDTETTLKKFLKQCADIKAIYDALGWELVSRRTVFTYEAYDEKVGKNVRIAGETDMVAVDRQGNYHIIDFKTSYKNFEDVLVDGKVQNQFEELPPNLSDGRAAKRSTKDHYTNQQTMYSIMVEATLGGTVDTIEILPFKLKYDAKDPHVWFEDIDNTKVVLSNDKKLTYGIKVPQRIMLTKNGELINRFSDKHDDKELEAKRKLNDAIDSLSLQSEAFDDLLYTIEFDTEKMSNLPQDQQDYIRSRNNAIRERIINVKGAATLVEDEESCNNLINQVRGIQQELEDLSQYIQQKIEDNENAIAESEKLRKQKEAEQQSHDAWIEQQASAQTKWSADWKAAFEHDFEKLVELCKYADYQAKYHNTDYSIEPELAQQLNQLISNLIYMVEFDNEVLGTTTGRIIGLDSEGIDKVNWCIHWAQDIIHGYTPVPPVTPPTTIEEYNDSSEAWKQTNGLFKDPYKNFDGVSSSVAMDNPSLKLSDVTKNADFITNSEFRVIYNNGKLFIQITYGGHTYKPVTFYHAETKEGSLLRERMIEALKHANSNQKVVITGGVKRSFGEFIVKQEGSYKTAHEQGMIALKDGEPGVNIYDIEYSSTQHTIGVTYTREVQNGANVTPVTEVRVPQDESTAQTKFAIQQQESGWITDKQTGAKRRMTPDSPYALSYGSSIYTYSNANVNKPRTSGIFVFMHNLGYTDDPKCAVPVVMRRAFLTENDANFIVDALLGKYNNKIKRKVNVASQNSALGFVSTTEYVDGFGGNAVVGGQTLDVAIADIVDMLIPVKGCASYQANVMRQNPNERMPIYLDLDNVNETGEVLIVGNVQGDGIETKQRSYNIRVPESLNELIEALQIIERNINTNGFAQIRLGNIGAKTDQYGYPMPLSDKPVDGITIKEYVKRNGTLKFGNSCIQFDSSDFSNPAIQGDENGISGMGWYLKNGFLECMYNGTADPLIRIENDATISTIDNVVINPLKDNIGAKEQKIVKESLSNGVAQTSSDDLAKMLWEDLQSKNSSSPYSPDDFNGLFKEQNEHPNKPINEKEARKNLERILGSSVPVQFMSTVINAAKCGASVVGLCREDGILLSRMAEAGVEYHEAFHRVMELLFTPEQRQKAYDKFRNAKDGRQNLTDKQIAEIFADEFMYYAMNQPTVKLHWNILKTFREIKDWCSMWKEIGSYNLFRMYAAINSGKYANIKPDERSKELFAKYTKGKGYAYTTNGYEFQHIINGVHYKKLLNFIAMSFMHPSIQKINVDGSNFDKFRLEKDLLIKRQPTTKTEEIEYAGKDGKVHTKTVTTESPVMEDTSLDTAINFFTLTLESKDVPESTRLALREMIDHFDVIKHDLAAYISLFASDYKIKYEQDNYNKKEGVDTIGGQFDDQTPTESEDDIYDSWLDDHTKESYEFAPISRMTEKTKFFFSAIAKKRQTDTGWEFELNELGLPEMYDAQYAFITVLNEISNCKSIPEMNNRLLKLGEHDDLFNSVAARFNALWQKVLNGNANADDQALIVQLFTQLKSTTNEFMLAKGSHKKNGDYDVVLEKTDQSYNATQYVRDWAQAFAIGGCRFFRQTEDGSYVMNGNFTANVFNTVVSSMSNIQQSVVNGQYKTISEIDTAKRQFIFYLTTLGIPFTKSMLDKQLWHKYEDVGAEGLKKFFIDNQIKLDAFYKKIAALNKGGNLNITEDGHVAVGNRLPLDKHFANDQFLTELASAKYLWHRSHDQMSVLIANNAKAYAKSENNLITDRLDEIMYDEEAQRQLMSDVFNYTTDKNGRIAGSIMLKNKGKKLRFITMGGFKTDEYGNAGIDYLQQSKREDYIGKAIALLDGNILCPTLSDKKTWGFIAGLEPKMSEFGYAGMSGADFFDAYQEDGQGNVTDFYIPDTVITQMLEYAECEYQSIKHVLSQMGTDANGETKWLIPENHLIDNFHKSKLYIKDGKVYAKKAPKGAAEVHPVQGARFTSLLGVYENGKLIEFNQILDEYGNYKDEKANLKTAEEAFFNKPILEKRRLIREVLLQNIRQELKAVEDLGLIRRKAVNSNTKDALFTYENVGLPSSRIDALYNAILSKFTEKEKAGLTIAKKQAYESLAIASFVADVMNRHIISMQEFERMFSGNPAFFKFGYDSAGHLVDRTVDQSKRLGGLASTGTNNCLDLPDMPKDYRCVEIENPEPPASDLDFVKNTMYDCEIRNGYVRYLLQQEGLSYDENVDDTAPEEEKATAKSIVDKVYDMSIEDIKKAIEGTKLADVLETVATSKANKFEKIDVADGAAYITDEMCENLLKMVGSWSTEIEQAFDILRGKAINPKTGKPYTVSDSRATNAYNKIITTVIGAQKYTAYGYRFQDGLAIPYYNKMALFPMFKNMCTGNMAKLYKAAKDQHIDMIMINSAVKVGSQSKYNVDDADWDNLELDKHAYTQKYAYLRKQFNTDPKEQQLMAIKTQMMKVVMAAMIPGFEYTVNGETKSATDIRDDIMDALNKMSDIGRQQLLDKFFKDGEFDVKAFSDILKDELSSRGATKELLDGCEVKDGKMALTIDAMSGMNWIQSILVAMVNKKVVDVNAPGGAFYQRSVWGMEGSTTIIDDTDLPPSINEGEKLKVLNNVGSMDCVLSIDFFHEVLKGTKAEHADFESQRKYLIRKGIIGPDAKANMIGYRVPTQAISSIHALRCVDVLPTVRDTVILPAEFTKITGSDFDIDKIFITMKHYQRIVDEERSKDGEVHHITTDRFDKDANPEEYYCNKLIDNQLALLTDERVFNQLNGSIDDDTELLTSIVADLDEGVNKNTLNPYQVATLSFQANTKDKFVTGKVGIGPFALNNNSQILTMLYGVKFRFGSYQILDKLGLRDLSSAMDRDNKSIMSWLSGLINAHVDVAKDPYISRLNVNPYTYNLVNLLVRTGLGKTTFYFTTQPIMQQLASVYNTASGVYMIDEGLSKSQAQDKAISQAIIEYVGANTGVRPNSMRNAISEFQAQFKDKHGIDAIDAIQMLFSKDNSILHDISKGGSVEDLKNKKDEMYNLTKDIQLSFYEVQMLVILANEQFKEPAEKLSDIVKFSKIDTKKQGKNMSEIRSYRRGVYRTFEDSVALNTFENIDKLYENSYIKTKTDNAISAFISILGGQSISATEQFDTELQSILKRNEYKARSADTISKVTKALLAQIKAKFFFDKDAGYCHVNGIDPKSLIDGKNCIYNRLLRIKAIIMSQPEYADYRDASGNPINYLLQVLTSGYTTDVPNERFDTAKFVQIASITQSDEINPQDLITAWDSLLHDDLHPELKQFARDLVVYTFFTSVDNGGNRDLFKYVPNSWKFESGYAAYMDRILQQFKEGKYPWTDADRRDVFLNNADDNFFVPAVKKDKFTVMDRSGVLVGIKITNEHKNVDGKATVVPAVTFTYDSYSNAPDYIKIVEGSEADGNQTTRVYAKTNAGIINGREYPIYSQVNQRKVKFKAGNITYGYGSNAEIVSNAAGNEFMNLYTQQMSRVGTTIDQDNHLTIAAKDNMELTVGQSILLYKEYKKGEVAEESAQESLDDAYVNHSGGAVGSDSYWGEIGERYGVKSNHYYHGQKTPNGNVEISQQDFEEGKYESAKAAKRNWGYQYDTMKDDRLIRNWAQVKYADEIVAIGHIVQPGERIFPNISNDTRTAIAPSVTGGTGYAVGMAILHNKPVYVFDQQNGKWYKWDNSANNFVESEIPILTKNFAGIGTRNLNEYGMKAIEDVYKKTFEASEQKENKFDDSDQSDKTMKQCKEQN